MNEYLNCILNTTPFFPKSPFSSPYTVKTPTFGFFHWFSTLSQIDLRSLLHQILKSKMKKNLFHSILGLTILLVAFHPTYGQSTHQSIVLKKGEVLDILLLSQNKDVETHLKSYFQTAFPVAKRMSYQPMPGFKITSLLQGNHQPHNLILGKWSDLQNREDFLTQIIKEVPDFHERRRKIWSFFGLKYFEIKQDVTINIDRKKFHVATAFWMNSKKTNHQFYQKWENEISKMGGQMMLHLTEGTTPFGYQYNPTYFVISSWENETQFKAFQEKIRQFDQANVQHINEFILE